tara:strand:- start:3692 stop:4411 length:720 start_codon:yes stop_codon:yes gene_type:complete
LRQNFSENWFYLLKSDELQEAINKRDDFLKRYRGNSQNNYYNLPKALRFIGPLQPLGELRGEKWLTGDWYLSGKPSYQNLNDIYAISLRLELPFRFIKSYSIDEDPKFRKREHFLGFLADLSYTNLHIEVFSKNKLPIQTNLYVKPSYYSQALMDFVEIYNQPDNKYKNLQAYFDLSGKMEEVYHKYNMDEEYFLKQILDTEQENVKIKLNKNSPHFVVMRKHDNNIKNKLKILRELKL